MKKTIKATFENGRTVTRKTTKDYKFAYLMIGEHQYLGHGFFTDKCPVAVGSKSPGFGTVIVRLEIVPVEVIG
jgi:hypothetical protein